MGVLRLAKVVAGVAVIGFVLYVLLVTVGFGSLLPNLGLPFGYYGKFNRIRSELRALPHVEVLSWYLHEDIKLEDFGITVLADGKTEIELTFKTTDIRSMKDLRSEFTHLVRSP